ncbi:hypothetical protein JYU34_021805 [Plutella xylostella]|uniref:Uncharacterized protein n=1 Tax=Plutella xylostella TaxID=51655 RepID=A0ABQ7PSW7_PLUXY|nr:hypothetical protein JYU34_021805 [Plutella xylostella]
MNNSCDNITIRRTQVNNTTVNRNESLLDISYQSLPETVGYDDKEHSDLIEKIGILTMKLETANGEIDNLNLENSLLKKEITDCQNKLKIYKSLGIDDLNSSTPTKYLSPQYRRIRPTNVQSGIPRTSPNQFTCRSAKFLTDCRAATATNNHILQESFKTSSPKDKQMPTHNNKVYRPEDDVATIRLTESPTLDPKPDTRQRVALFSDAEGRGMRPFLQNLLGGGFKVCSFLKPNATLDQIMEGCDHNCRDFTKKDYIIIITKSIDKNPLKLQSFLYYYLNMLQHTNVIFGQICTSKFLNEAKLNSVINLICNNFNHATFVDFQAAGIRNNSKLIKCRVLLREILKQCYHHNYTEFKSASNVSSADKGTQTVNNALSLDDCNCNEIVESANDNGDKLFR